MPIRFPEMRGTPQFWKKPLFTKGSCIPAAEAIAVASSQMLLLNFEIPLNSGKVTSPLKTTQFEGAKINFGPQFLFFASSTYVACTFFAKKLFGQI